MDTRSEELADLLGQKIEQNLRAKGHLTIPYSAFVSPYFLEYTIGLCVFDYQHFGHETYSESLDNTAKACAETVLEHVEDPIIDVLAFDLWLYRTGQWMFETAPDGSRYQVPTWGSDLFYLKIQTKRKEAVL